MMIVFSLAVWPWVQLSGDSRAEAASPSATTASSGADRCTPSNSKGAAHHSELSGASLTSGAAHDGSACAGARAVTHRTGLVFSTDKSAAAAPRKTGFAFAHEPGRAFSACPRQAGFVFAAPKPPAGNPRRSKWTSDDDILPVVFFETPGTPGRTTATKRPPTRVVLGGTFDVSIKTLPPLTTEELLGLSVTLDNLIGVKSARVVGNDRVRVAMSGTTKLTPAAILYAAKRALPSRSGTLKLTDVVLTLDSTRR